MSAVFANRTARRRTIAYVGRPDRHRPDDGGLGEPLRRRAPARPGFAFKPVQRAINGFGLGISSIGRRDRRDRPAAARQRRPAGREPADPGAGEAGRRDQAPERGPDRPPPASQCGFDYKTAAATVIARDSSEVQQRVTLDRGTADGVAIGDVVIASGGALVGRVIDASSSTSTVQLISDSGSTVVGQLITSAATGEVTGQLPGSLLMQNIDAAVTVGLGEEVVTAGIELAGGIRRPIRRVSCIGTVIDVRRDANEVVQTAYLQPAADLTTSSSSSWSSTTRAASRPAGTSRSRVRTRREPCRRVSSRASAPTPAHRPAPGRARSRAGHRVPHPDPGAPVSSRLSRPAARRATRQGRRRPG